MSNPVELETISEAEQQIIASDIIEFCSKRRLICRPTESGVEISISVRPHQKDDHAKA